MSNDLANSERPGSGAVEQANRLLDALASSKASNRVEAEQALLEVGEAEAKAIHEAVLQRIRNWSRYKHRSEGRGLWYGLSLCAAILLPWPLKPFIGTAAMQILAVSSVGVLLFAAFVDDSGCRGRSRAKQASFEVALEVLTREPNAAQAPILLQIYAIDRFFRIGVPSRPIFLQQALIDALFRVRQSDAALFCPVQRRQLITLLENSTQLASSSQQPELAVAAIRVLEMLGDYSAKPVMKHLCEKGVTPSVSHAARACYAALTAVSQAPENVLLRGSASPDVPADVLLRAASGSGTTQPAELLRGAGENDRVAPAMQPTQKEQSVRKANEEARREDGKQMPVGLAQERAEDR